MYMHYAYNIHAEKKWKEENSSAIAAFNERVEKCGVFSDGLRSF